MSCCEDEEIVKMVARMNELKEKQDPGSTKKEKDGKKDDQADGGCCCLPSLEFSFRDIFVKSCLVDVMFNKNDKH